MKRKNIDIDDLVPMEAYIKSHPIIVDVAYACDSNILFQQAIYKKDAQLYLHRKLADVVLLASQYIYDSHGYKTVLYDGLRTTDAQEYMLTTKRVLANPNWLKSPALLSSPGSGAHPRAMAIDMTLIDSAGKVIDMGTPFDYLAENPAKAFNAAHRDYAELSEKDQKSRDILTHAMLQAANELKVNLLPLPQEWWDFRLMREEYEQYNPLSEQDLPEYMRLMS